MFCLCNNYDNAAAVLVQNLAYAFENHLATREQILRKTQEFIQTVQGMPQCDVSQVHQMSLQVLLQMIQIILDVEASKGVGVM